MDMRDPKIAALQACPTLASLPRSELGRIATCFDLAELEPRQVLTSKGTPSRALWLIVDGEAESAETGAVPERHGAGSLLGLDGMFGERDAPATIAATGRMRVLVASKPQFNRVIFREETELRLRRAAQRSLPAGRRRK